ncbi:alkaline phosphatase PhoX [Haladaptatus sp. ZSTT2]|uniref:alkaline phosphatase PhoX n=1 Tax=Haladaptatus sp. ZSTT2 TaxID=3120515 RepID=UPI00300E867A
MPSNFSRRNLMLASALAAMGSYAQSAQAARGEHHDHDDGPTLNRFATTVKGAEITGLFLTAGGQLFFNVQHPSEENDVHEGYQQGAVGHLRGFNMHNLPGDFESVQLPKNESQREQVRTARGSYEFLAHGGEKLSNGELLGIPTSPEGEPLTEGMNPDFNGFVPVAERSGRGQTPEREGYLFTNWEARPGAMTRLHLKQRGNHYEVVGRMNVDFSGVEGTWVNCFGSVSPWNTPLTSEELYFDNTADWNNPDYGYIAGVENLAVHLGYYPNPYRYGYITEITEPESDDPTPQKLTPMGRFSHENSIVMPDERTVYLSDDGTGTVFFKFVADEPGDLTAGTLYAAKASQDRGSDYNTVGFDLDWLELAHASTEEIETWIAEYDGITQDDYVASENSYITDAEIEAWARGEAADDRVAFLESRKAAEAIGATAEFRKMEGVNIKRDAKPGDYLYMAMSAVTKTMADDEGEIQLADNEYGAVYRMRLGADYDVSRMEPVVTGGPNANVCGGCPYDASPDSANNACQDCVHNPKNEENDGFATFAGEQDPDNTIANPDNLVVMDDGRVIIGEDSGLHDNNMIWVYNPGE